MKKINTLTVKLLKKISSQNNKPYKFGVPNFQKLGGLTFPPENGGNFPVRAVIMSFE
jgi:hypothetical protein